jgi:hypothetical protein
MFSIHRGRVPSIRVALTLCAIAVLSACGGDGGEAGEPGLPDNVVLAVSDVGFATPESVLHDADSDVYLVANINGVPSAKDGNGFISRVSPEGEVLELKWIDGATEGINLDAPKGMAITEDRLFVSDIDCVRVFRLEDRVQEDDVCFPDATFLNDVAVDQNGTLYVTDSGIRIGVDGISPTGSDAIYRFSRDGRRQNLASGESLGSPNGIFVGSRGIMVVTRGTGEIYRLAADAKRTPVLPPSERQLDGIVFTADGSMVFSDWASEAVYAVSPAGTTSTVISGVQAPADIGYDAARNRVLVPLFRQNAVWVVSLD